MRIPFLKLPPFPKVSLVQALVCLSLNWIAAASLAGQSEKDPFEGNWAVTSKASEAVIVLLKPSGEASYFKVKGTDQTVYQGQWSTLEGVATATWADGSEHRFRRGAFDLVATFINAAGKETKDLTAKAVPDGVLGQWAKPPARDDADTADLENTFFGLWEMENAAGETVFVMVSPDRSAATNVGGSDVSGLHGAWIKQGSELHLIWENGDYSILREAARGHDYTRIPGGLILEEAPRDFRAITRTATENAPTDWLDTYRAQQEATPSGYIFSSRKDARNFYRGTWLIQHADEIYERITVRKYGGLETSRDPSLHGDWLLSGQNVMLRWDDGMRKILSPAGRGFVYYSYAPGQPLDGVPTRIRPATPEGAEKLSALQAGRKAFAETLLARAQAAGIHPGDQGKAGPGNWVWPFKRQKSEGGEALLTSQQTGDAGYSNDPWWWPLWSEQSPIGEKETEGGDAALDAEPESEELKAKTGLQPLRVEKNKWYWPF